jgi:hypothetical protein
MGDRWGRKRHTEKERAIEREISYVSFKHRKTEEERD